MNRSGAVSSFKEILSKQGCKKCDNYEGVTKKENEFYINCKKKCTIFAYFSGLRWFLTINVTGCKLTQKQINVTKRLSDFTKPS